MIIISKLWPITMYLFFCLFFPLIYVAERFAFRIWALHALDNDLALESLCITFK